MREIILALLTAKFAGVRKDALLMMARAFALQVSTEEEAKTLVDKVTDAQVAQFVKEVRADVDKEVSDSTKTFEANLKKKYNFVNKVEPGNQGKDDTDPNDIASIVKAAVDAAVNPLKEQIQGYETRNLTESRLHALNEKLSGCKDENFKSQTLKDFGRMTFKDDADFNEYLTSKEADIATANQNKADDDLSHGGGNPFASKGVNEDGVSNAVSEYIDSKKAENNPFSGKTL